MPSTLAGAVPWPIVMIAEDVQSDIASSRASLSLAALLEGSIWSAVDASFSFHGKKQILVPTWVVKTFCKVLSVI